MKIYDKSKHKRSRLTGSQKSFLWILGVPTFLLYIYICVLPMIESVYNSMTSWDGYSEKNFLGFSNYAEIITDSVFHKAIINDFMIVVFKEIIIVLLAVTFSIALTRIRLKKQEKLILRFLYYIPNILSVIVITMVWKFFFNLGLFDQILELFYLTIPTSNGWLSDYPIPIIIFVASWCGIGTFMIILITAINNISAEIYEAAEIDGAGQFKQLFGITIPAILPQIRYVLITILTTSLAANMNLVLPFTNGGPGDKTIVMGLYVYKSAYTDYDVGYANAAAILLMILSVVFASAVNKLLSRKEMK